MVHAHSVYTLVIPNTLSYSHIPTLLLNSIIFLLTAIGRCACTKSTVEHPFDTRIHSKETNTTDQPAYAVCTNVRGKGKLLRHDFRNHDRRTKGKLVVCVALLSVFLLNHQRSA